MAEYLVGSTALLRKKSSQLTGPLRSEKQIVVEILRMYSCVKRPELVPAVTRGVHVADFRLAAHYLFCFHRDYDLNHRVN